MEHKTKQPLRLEYYASTKHFALMDGEKHLAFLYYTEDSLGIGVASWRISIEFGVSSESEASMYLDGLNRVFAMYPYMNYMCSNLDKISFNEWALDRCKNLNESVFPAMFNNHFKEQQS